MPTRTSVSAPSRVENALIKEHWDEAVIEAPPAR